MAVTTDSSSLTVSATTDSAAIVIRPARLFRCRFTMATGEVVDLYTNVYLAESRSASR